MSAKNKTTFFGPSLCTLAGGSDRYVGTSAIVMIFPTGLPKCLTPLVQQSPGGPARTGDSVDVDMSVGAEIMGCGEVSSAP